MNAPPGNFPELRRRIIRRFLRTAVVIDDEIGADAVVTEPGPLVNPAVGAEQAVEHAAPAGDHGADVGQHVAADVMIKPLADAFLDEQIMCAVLKPVPEDDSIIVARRAVAACSNADIVILDWYLRANDPDLTLEILAELLKEDELKGGRMRLILLYTSAAPLSDRAEQLEKHLEKRGRPVSSFDEDDRPALRVGSTKIIFVGKSGLGLGVEEQDLPGVALESFAKEADGLMPLYAMAAIAKVRDGTHHLLSVFRADLDAAYLGHRMLQSDPSDADNFLLGVLLLQLRGMLHGIRDADEPVSEKAVSMWLRDRENEEFLGALEKLELDPDVLSKYLERGIAEEHRKLADKLHTALHMPEGNAEEDVKMRPLEFARLSSMLREAEGITPLPADWLPHLTLGSVLRKDRDGEEPEYLLCTQPACDTVRLKGQLFFSFLRLESGKSDKNTFWLAVRSNGEDVMLRTKKAPAVAVRYHALFDADEETRRIVATRDEQNGCYLFKDADDNSYVWLGDLDAMKAQRAASEMVSALARVGIDEYEWLRLGGKLTG